MRYSVNAPTGTNETRRHIGSALTPRLTRPAGAWSSRGPIIGSPGTSRVSAPAPSAVPQTTIGMAAMGRSRSSDSPNFILPPLYWVAGSDQEHAPVSRLSDNQMPIPAVRPVGVIVANPYVSRKGGNRQVVQPQVVQRWPGMNGLLRG